MEDNVKAIKRIVLNLLRFLHFIFYTSGTDKGGKIDRKDSLASRKVAITL